MELGLCSREYWPGEELTSHHSQMGIHWDVACGWQGERRGAAGQEGVSQPTVVGVWGVGLGRQKKTKKGKQHQCTQVHSRMGNTGKCSKEKPECLCGSDGAGVAGSGTGWEGIRAGAEVARGRQQWVLVASLKGVAVLGLCRDLTHLWRGCGAGGRELPWLGRRGKGLTWAGVGCSLGLGVNPLSLSGATGWSSSSSWPREDAALPHGNTSNPFHGKNNSSIPLWQALLVHFSFPHLSGEAEATGRQQPTCLLRDSRVVLNTCLK